MAVRVLEQEPLLPVACALEAYSGLTRLPAPNRAPARLVRDFLRDNFDGRFVQLSGAASQEPFIGDSAEGPTGHVDAVVNGPDHEAG